MQTASFEWSDVLEPTRMLCKVDNYMNAVNGHIDVIDDPDLVSSWIHKVEMTVKSFVDRLF